MLVVVAVALVSLTGEVLDPVHPVASAFVEPLVHIEVPSVKLRKNISMSKFRQYMVVHDFMTLHWT